MARWCYRIMVSYRVVTEVAGNSEAVTLSGLRADTQYQLVVTAVRAGKRFRSRPIVFRTLGKLFLFNLSFRKLYRRYRNYAE